MYIALLGAYERDNFGDILFMHVTERLLTPWPTVPLGVVSADVSMVGGRQVVSASSWFDVCKNFTPHALIAVGGETLTCDLESALAFTLPPSVANSFARLRKIEQTDFSKRIGRRSGTLPYADLRCIPPTSRSLIKVGYNSIGGTQLDKPDNSGARSQLSAILADADYISVRDKITQAHLTACGISRTHLYPDIVSTIAEICAQEIENGKKNLSPLLNSSVNDYIVFQASDRFIKEKSVRDVAHQLYLIATAHNFSIVLQPAGLAYEHDTLSSLEEAQRKLVEYGLSENRVRIQRDRDIWTQVAAIANSRCFIGTSLHGRIVAASTGVPRVSLENSKVASYAECWDGDIQPFSIPVYSLKNSTDEAINIDPRTLRERARRLSAQALEGFSKLRHALAIRDPSDEADVVIRAIESHSKAALYQELEMLREQAADIHCDFQTTLRQLNAIEKAKISIENSWSWRLTSPLRRTKKLVYEKFISATHK